VSPLLVVHLAVAAGYAGFQWTVQVLVYRQFELVPAAAFVAYEQAHQRRVSFVVGPLFAGLTLTTAGVLFFRPAGTPWWAGIVGAVLLVVILGVTAFLAVPLHGRLSTGFEKSVYRSLLRVDLVRAVAATLDAALAAWLLLG
jgi:hypothetical protein